LSTSTRSRQQSIDLTCRTAVPINDLHAKQANLLGLDQDKLTNRYSGRDIQLTDLGGTVAKDVVA
jgi:hypothetical protein